MYEEFVEGSTWLGKRRNWRVLSGKEQDFAQLPLPGLRQLAVWAWDMRQTVHVRGLDSHSPTKVSLALCNFYHFE